MRSLRDRDWSNAKREASLQVKANGRSNPRSGEYLKFVLGYGSLFAVVLFVSQFMLSRMGVEQLTLLLVFMFFGVLYAAASWRSLVLPFMMVFLAVGGFRFLWAVKMPGLPDMYLDRIALIWLVVIFGLKSVALRRAIRPPFLLDTLLVVNVFYLFMSLMVNDFSHFSIWTKSYLVPYAIYFMAKNIMTTQRAMRSLLVLFAVLNVYYSVTSIAEKFGINQLIWPKSIIYAETVWVGRSNGPFAHAPLFGTVMGMIMPCYLYLIATSRSRFMQLLGYGALALGVAGLYFTYTRGSWLAGITALIVAMVLNKRQYFKISLPAVAILPLIAIFVLGAGNDQVMKDRASNEDTVSSRVGVGVTALRMWRDNPVFGVGFFQFRHVRYKYVDAVEVPIIGTVRFINFRNTSIHDIYLGPLAETGLVGAFLQLAIYLVIFKAFLNHLFNRRGPPHFRIFILPIFGGMCVGYLFGGIAIDYRFFSMVGAMFYGAAGIVYGYTGDEEVSAKSDAQIAERLPHA